jgi:hypothetical protein
MENLYDSFVRALAERTREKQLDVAKKRETPELAAVELKAYGLGLAKAMVLTGCPGHELFMAEIDEMLEKIDLDYAHHKKIREGDRPMGLAGYSFSMLIIDDAISWK